MSSFDEVHRGFVRLILAVMLNVSSATAATPGSFDHFRCLLSGHWDNVRQANKDALLGKDGQNAHPRRAMTYIPVANPDLEGQLFAILNYTEQGFDEPVLRVSLHRFRWAEDEQRIVHEFFFLKQPEEFGELASDLTPLGRLQETDARTNARCSMRWQWIEDHYEGRTTAGECITDSFTDRPILVEGHGELRPDELIRHDRNFELTGADIAIPGGATPEIFDRVNRTAIPARLAGQIEAVSASFDCDREN